MGVRGLLHRNPQFLYLHHSSDGTVKAQNSMQLPSADCATNCANSHVSRHSLWEVALSISRPPRGMIALSRGNRQGLGTQIQSADSISGTGKHAFQGEDWKRNLRYASKIKMTNLISLSHIFSKIHLYLSII